MILEDDVKKISNHLPQSNTSRGSQLSICPAACLKAAGGETPETELKLAFLVSAFSIRPFSIADVDVQTRGEHAQNCPKYSPGLTFLRLTDETAGVLRRFRGAPLREDSDRRLLLNFLADSGLMNSWNYSGERRPPPISGSCLLSEGPGLLNLLLFQY